jgi:penicillin amidase
LFNALQGVSSGVPQRHDFLKGQAPDTVVRAALASAVADLTRQHGADMSQWLTPAPKHRFSKTNAIGVPWATQDQEAALYQNRGTAGFRVVLRKNAVEMCSLMAPGQSGFVSPELKKPGTTTTSCACLKPGHASRTWWAPSPWMPGWSPARP